MKAYVLQHVKSRKFSSCFYPSLKNGVIDFNVNDGTWKDEISYVYSSSYDLWKIIRNNTRYVARPNKKYISFINPATRKWDMKLNPNFVVINNKEYWNSVFSEFQVLEYDLNFTNRIIDERIVPWNELCPKRLPDYWVK